MKHNVGSYDAAIRFFIGCGIMYWGVHVHSWWALIGLIPVLTSAFAFCPLYCLFRIDTTYTDRDPAS